MNGPRIILYNLGSVGCVGGEAVRTPQSPIFGMILDHVE